MYSIVVFGTRCGYVDTCNTGTVFDISSIIMIIVIFKFLKNAFDAEDKTVILS
jgi:hypothetical protein